MEKYALVRKRYSFESESYEYSSAGFTRTLASARKLADKANGLVGDIIYVCDIVHVTQPEKTWKSYYVVDEDGAANKCDEMAKYFSRIDDMEFWCSKADEFLDAASRSMAIDKKLMIAASLACAKTSFEYIPGKYKNPRIVANAIEAYLRGEVDEDYVKEANAYDNYEGVFDTEYATAAYSITYVVDAIEDSFQSSNAAAAAAKASDNYEIRIRELMPLVSQFIPIKTLIEAYRKVT